MEPAPQYLSNKGNESSRENSKMDVVVKAEINKNEQGSETLGLYNHFYSGVSADKIPNSKPKQPKKMLNILKRIPRSARRLITKLE